MKFRRSIGWSIAGHSAILALAIFGLPNIRMHEVPPIESIAIDVIDFSDLPQKSGEKSAPKSNDIVPAQAQKPLIDTPQPKPEPKPKEVTSPAQPPKQPAKPDVKPVEPTPQELPKPPKVEAKPQPKPEPKQESKLQEPFDPDGLLKKIAAAQKPTQPQKEAPKPQAEPEPKPVEKPSTKPQPTSQSNSQPPQTKSNTANLNDFDPTKISQLLNKEKPAASAAASTIGKPQEATQGAPKGLGAKLTQSQYAALQGMIREQVSKCWSPPAGGGGANVKVQLEIAMNSDGSLSGIPKITNSSSDPNFRPVAESAVRAVRRCAPLKLPAEQYNSENGWKEIEFIFDPSQI